MSLDRVLETLSAALADPATGLAVRVEDQAQARGYSVGATADSDIRSDFRFVEWRLSGQMQPSAPPEIAVSMQRSTESVNPPPMTEQTGTHTLVIGYGFVTADLGQLQRNVVLVKKAVLGVLRELQEYSREHGGTVAQVQGDVDTVYGDFGGDVITESGFQCVFVVEELSQE